MSNNKAIYPEDSEGYYKEWGFSPGYIANGLLFVSGCTGTRADGSVPTSIEEQTSIAFQRIEKTLRAAGTNFSNIVEMTTYRVGMGKSLESFLKAKSEYINEPFPAWTAIGVSELASRDAKIEIRAIVSLPIDP